MIVGGAETIDIPTPTGAMRLHPFLPAVPGLSRAETPFVFGRPDPHVPFPGRQATRARLEGAGASKDGTRSTALIPPLRDEGPRFRSS